MKFERCVRATVTLTIAALTLGCSSRPAAGPPVRILFIGNSLTYVNDLPALVASVGSSGGTDVEVGMVAFPDFSLEDHWHDGRALDRIRSQPWSFVVMQQGPSALESSRASLIEWSQRFADEIRTVGGAPVLLTVWPPRSRIAELARVIESYRLAADHCGCRLIPAGAVWSHALDEDSGVPLYGPDGFHPSVEGSALAALATWVTILGGDPDSSPSHIRQQDHVLLIDRRRLEIYRHALRATLAEPRSQS